MPLFDGPVGIKSGNRNFDRLTVELKRGEHEFPTQISAFVPGYLQSVSNTKANWGPGQLQQQCLDRFFRHPATQQVRLQTKNFVRVLLRQLASGTQGVYLYQFHHQDTRNFLATVHGWVVTDTNHNLLYKVVSTRKKSEDIVHACAPYVADNVDSKIVGVTFMKIGGK